MVLYLLGLSWYENRFVIDISFWYEGMFEQLEFQGGIIRKLYEDTYTGIYFPPGSVFDIITEWAYNIYPYFVLHWFCTEQFISKVKYYTFDSGVILRVVRLVH